MSEMDFAALLCSRLCHDLVSPVGAISNGLEILQDEHDENMREQVMDLLEQSAEQTSNKLQFFRLAFGAAGGFSSELDLRESKNSLTSFLSGTRVELNWQVSMICASKQVVKLLMNLCLIGSESLIRGGVLTVEMASKEKTIDIKVSVGSERIILQDVVKKTLIGQIDASELEPRSAPAYLAAAVAKELGGEIILIDAENSISFNAKVINTSK